MMGYNDDNMWCLCSGVVKQGFNRVDGNLVDSSW